MPKKRPPAKTPGHIVDLAAIPDPRILALDLSLSCTGWAECSRHLSPHLEHRYGTIVPDTKGVARLKQIKDSVRVKLVSGGGADRTLVLLENYAFGKANQAHQMGELGGVIRLLLHEEGYPFFVIPPTRLKKFLTGKGVADKNIILKEVFKRWQFDVDDDNVADALVLMQLGLALIGQLENMTKFQQEVVQEVLKDLSKIEE